MIHSKLHARISTRKGAHAATKVLLLLVVSILPLPLAAFISVLAAFVLVIDTLILALAMLVLILVALQLQ